MPVSAARLVSQPLSLGLKLDRENRKTTRTALADYVLVISRDLFIGPRGDRAAIFDRRRDATVRKMDSAVVERFAKSLARLVY